ncbi:unnamed protein product [Triticum turgidum subsp. durum]|uniref:aldehyde oxygenase (deformylating) n=1 Tax=Triticum turgidum subsp. durum TaxID=4567 RepID=A0A9R0TPW2_TRITD|nr:unnamed protein product [Triticum turgidum subsp. durum]
MGAAFLSSWPWDNLGFFKYVLYGPLVGKALAGRAWEAASPDRWLCLLLALFALRALTYQLWSSYSNMLFLTRRRRIVRDGVDFEQIDKEWDWAFHGARLFARYHALHHSNMVPTPFTAGFATPLEHVVLGLLMALPLAGACAAGLGSVGLTFAYVLSSDFLRAMGHCNVELFPGGLFRSLPLLRYLIYTPTYHTIHHTGKKANFCLFMPLFDRLGGTLDASSWELQTKNRAGMDEVPDFVFLAHVVDVMQSMHVPFVMRTFASTPFAVRAFLLPLWPIALLFMFMVWAWSKTFVISYYHLRGKLHQIWAVPRYGFHYFLPFAKDGINDQIELAILRADRMGVKVVSLAALNKVSSSLHAVHLAAACKWCLTAQHPNLRVRVVHGNTLTAAVILNEIPKGTTEVFMTGATSKLGRAIALYLCRKKIRVMMMTLSTERFQKIQKEAAAEDQQYLVQVTKFQSAEQCKTWIVGKWLSPREQRSGYGT